MSGLLSIAPVTETIDVLGSPVTVRGVSARGIASLLGRFPELRMLMSGKEVDATKLMAIAPDGVAAIIAAGTGSPGDVDAETIADQLPLDSQADLLGAILRITLPKGIAPFVEKLAALGSVLNNNSGAPSTEQGTKSLKPSKA